MRNDRDLARCDTPKHATKFKEGKVILFVRLSSSTDTLVGPKLTPPHKVTFTQYDGVDEWTVDEWTVFVVPACQIEVVDKRSKQVVVIHHSNVENFLPHSRQRGFRKFLWDRIEAVASWI